MTLGELRDRFDPPHKADSKGRSFVQCRVRADCSTRGNPSLHLSADATGRLLAHCFARCRTDAVLSARGLTLASLMSQEADARGKLWRGLLMAPIPFVGTQATIRILGLAGVASAAQES